MGGAEALGPVFDHRECCVFCGNGFDPDHIRTLAVDADRHDGFGAGRDDRFDQGRIHVKGVGLDINEHGFGVEQGNHLGGGNPGIGDGDDLVTRMPMSRAMRAMRSASVPDEQERQWRDAHEIGLVFLPVP